MNRDRDAAEFPVSTHTRWLSTLAAVSALLLLSGVLLVSVAPRNPDEAVYILMADAAAHGRLTIENGYDEYAAPALRFESIRVGRTGLVPQYPSGYGFLVLPFYLLGGIRGLILLNMVAFLMTAGLVYRLCALFGGARPTCAAAALIFGLSTFSMPYALGIWPHSIATVCVTGALWAIIAASQAIDTRKGVVLSVACGLLIGVGIHIRVDTILIAPPILLWLAAQRQYWARIILLIAGTIPGILVASWLNYLKFGLFAPISYGTGGTGNTTLAGYQSLIPLALAATIAAVALSHSRIRAMCTARSLLVVAGLGVLAGLALEPLRELLVRTISGSYVLVVDFQAYLPTGPQSSAFSRGPDGHLLLVGLLKRALLQSLPWLGVLPLTVLVWRTRRPLLALFLLVMACWIAPFSLSSWHGGGAPNMRYFLPVLPLLSAVSALCVSMIWSRTGIKLGFGSGDRFILWTAVAACIVTVLVTVGVASLNGLALSLAAWGSLALAAASAMVTIIMTRTGSTGDRRIATLGLSLALTCLIWSSGSMLLYDLLTDQLTRNVSESTIEAADRLGDGALIITGKFYQFMPQLMRTDSYVAVPDADLSLSQRALVDHHLIAGRRVYLDGLIAEPLIRAMGPPSYESRDVDFADRVLVELISPHD